MLNSKVAKNILSKFSFFGFWALWLLHGIFLSILSINYFSKIENRYFFHNAFAFFKKKFLTKYPFDEQLVGKEDRYWAKKLLVKNLIFCTIQITLLSIITLRTEIPGRA